MPGRELRSNLVLANRILAHEGVLDAYGHVSVRDLESPDRFLLARSMGPELVTEDDILLHDLTGELVTEITEQPYVERFIHAAIYAARPDCVCVVHAHAEAILPFGISRTPLVPVIHDASDLGSQVPIWDIARKFGDRTNLLVSNIEMGQDLANALGSNSVVLMRGHGFAAAGTSVAQTVRTCVYMLRNARVLTIAKSFGSVQALSDGEIAARNAQLAPDSPAMMRAWDTWVRRLESDERSPRPGAQR